MPIYEFKCPSCGNRIELLCAMGEQGHGLTCPNCGRTGLIRVLSAFATASRGGGERSGSGCAGCAGGSCSTCH